MAYGWGNSLREILCRFDGLGQPVASACGDSQSPRSLLWTEEFRTLPFVPCHGLGLGSLGSPSPSPLFHLSNGARTVMITMATTHSFKKYLLFLCARHCC